ncbi:sugar-binding domain-containing protein [Marispirochaeta sp.]|uniref:sugar-binding domain-containing protein n=1 Tax=Marispirochaeta sp. TaxID=2038653 RepID=UPI0029C9816E|nr:sugar-binding domain-containing protein [Marispirochaeta sp.]
MSDKKKIDLHGQWQVFLDAEDRGNAEKWYEPASLAGKHAHPISFPGSLELAGIGNPVTSKTDWVGSRFGDEFLKDPLYEPYRADDDFRFPYWLQPETRFTGSAWYVKHITIPKHDTSSWQLVLERPHWETSVWVNGVFVGSCDSLSVPHRYDLPALEDGEVVLVIRVDNRMIWDVGPNAHSISDQTQGPWNGIVGQLALVPVSTLSLGVVSVYPNSKRRAALCTARVDNHEEQETSVTLQITRAGREPSTLTRSVEPGTAIFHMELDEMPLWDEYDPNLEDVHVLLKTDEGVVDEKTLQIGLRSVESKGKQLFVNGNQTFLRGTVECCVFPKTGHPPMEEGYWEYLFSQSKAYGLNHIRFHSWCPPEAAFRVADRMGFYLQVECPIWKNQGVAYDENKAFDDWLFTESERIVAEYGNHPSFLLFASGNEPDGRDKEVLGLWASTWNQRDARRLHTSASGWPALEENAYQVVPEPRVQAWGEELASRINAKAPETCSDYTAICEKYPGPVVTHEMGQWCVFPDFSEMKEYTGYLKPRNFEVFADILSRRGLAGQAGQFLQASGFQQVLCYKEEIEAALRTGNLSGFQLLALTDFPGQGTALEGVLNTFWQEKGYCSGPQFRRFCSDIVLLARLPRRYYTAGETLVADIELANFGSRAIEQPKVTWRLSDEKGNQVQGGSLPTDQPAGRGLHSLATLSLSIPELTGAQKLTLSLTLEDPRRENEWDIWVFPEEVKLDAGDVVVADRWDEESRKALLEGGKVLLLASGESDVALGFSSVFWNTSWTGGQAPHTLGMVVDAEHPVFSKFPTENHSDWQWWELVHGGSAMVLDDLPHELSPMVQPIDTWFRSHKLGLLFECMIGPGKLMVCSMDVTSDLEHRTVARQLYHAILSYMQSNQFAPKSRLTVEEIGLLVRNEEA